METTTHLELKPRAVGFLRDLGCRAVATEVQELPNPRQRAILML